MRYDSFAHAPKSISLHRSEQNGRHFDSGDQGTCFPQVGQATLRASVMASFYRTLVRRLAARASLPMRKRAWQEIDASVNCMPRAIVVKRRVWLDHAGSVVNVSAGPPTANGFARIAEGAEAILFHICGAPSDRLDRPPRQSR